MVTDQGIEPRSKMLITRVTKDFKAAFRSLANRRGLTEAELLRELVARALKGAESDEKA